LRGTRWCLISRTSGDQSSATGTNGRSVTNARHVASPSSLMQLVTAYPTIAPCADLLDTRLASAATRLGGVNSFGGERDAAALKPLGGVNDLNVERPVRLKDNPALDESRGCTLLAS
jgi:hypothetical protein